MTYMKSYNEFLNEKKETIKEVEAKAKAIKKEYLALKKMFKANPDSKTLDMKFAAKEEQLRRAANKIRNMKADQQMQKEDVNEKKSYIHVAVRNAAEANDILRDQFRNRYKTDGSNYYIFKKDDDAYDALQSFNGEDIEILDTNIDESILEITSNPVSGTKAGSTYSLDNKKYILTKDVKGASIDGFRNVKLPKGTEIYNLPGGLFAKHFSLKQKYTTKRSGPDWNVKYGVRITQASDILKSIEKNSKVVESLNEVEKPDDDPCWDGYIQRGTKDKDGKEVPNCVPIEDVEESLKSLNERSSEGWVNAQMSGDAGGLDTGVKVMVHGDKFKAAEPNKDVEIFHKKKGYINVPKSFVQLSEDSSEGVIHESESVYLYESFEDFVNEKLKSKNLDDEVLESINSRKRSKIVVDLKKDGIKIEHDYDFRGGEFIAKDMDTVNKISDALGGKYKVTAYPDRELKTGEIPMMIS